MFVCKVAGVATGCVADDNIVDFVCAAEANRGNDVRAHVLDEGGVPALCVPDRQAVTLRTHR